MAVVEVASQTKKERIAPSAKLQTRRTLLQPDSSSIRLLDSERDRLPQIFERLEGTSVMTVSDVENFADAGGVAELVPVGATIKFRFNRQAAKASGLRPSARLLSLAMLVPANR